MNLVSQIIALLLSLLTKDAYKKVIDKLLDAVEGVVTNSGNKTDDAIVLPLCRKARELLNVPDDDEIG